MSLRPSTIQRFLYFTIKLMTSKEKTKFRQTQKWKVFRAFFLKKTNSSCELCGSVYSGKRKRMLQLHHRDPDNYTDLNPEKFRLICSGCHEMVEKISKKVLSNNSSLVNKEEWYILLKNFLPFKVEKRLLEKVNNG